MPTGRPATPIERKRAIGTLRNDRLPNQPIVITQPETPPEPPVDLGGEGLRFWEQVFTAAPWISHRTDLALVTMTAQQFDERDTLRAIVSEQPENPRLRSGLRDLEKAITSNLAQMGFTPSDRSRLGFAEVKKEGKLQELLRRKEEMENASHSQ
jgi:hypothetical protein|tara:strand:+ start:240 stop:701 length:462 start_codon:yes stop_codon:yes gene_type:complete